MPKKILLVLILIFTFPAFAQQNSDSLNVLRNQFEAFQYSKAVKTGEKMLVHKKLFNKEQLIEIYRLIGISEFSLMNDTAAKKNFVQILKINSLYSLDSAKTSPKIIVFFNQIKEEYNKQFVKERKNNIIKTDTVYITKTVPVETNVDIKPYIVRSLIFPGWGQLYYNKNDVKGWILTSLGAASLISSVYFIIDSNNNQKTYLNDVNPLTIQSDYNKYNTSYKIKNVSIISFVAVWLYSQIDVLFISDYNSSRPMVQLKTNSLNQFQLSFNVAF